jgi:type IV pilus assembly protein PilC
MYPIFILGLFALVVSGMVLFLVPRFKKLFSSLGADLPLPTKIVMSISDFSVKNFPLVLVSVIILIIAIRVFYKTKNGHYLMDKLTLGFPVFGALISKVILARFFQTLSTLLASGVDIVAALEITRKIVGNDIAEEAVGELKIKIMEGSNLASEMGKNDFFPRMTVRMTGIGEKAGRIDEMMQKISEYYTDEVDAAVEGFSSLIEPFLIIILGGVVGGFVVTMYLPVFRLATAMSGGM